MMSATHVFSDHTPWATRSVAAWRRATHGMVTDWRRISKIAVSHVLAESLLTAELRSALNHPALGSLVEVVGGIKVPPAGAIENDSDDRGR